MTKQANGCQTPNHRATLAAPTGSRAPKRRCSLGSLARRLRAIRVSGGTDVARMTSYARETRALADALAAYPLEWDLTGSGHIQPFRVTPDGRRQPILDGLGLPIVSSSTPRNPRMARVRFFHALDKAGAINKTATKRRKRVATVRPMIDRSYGEVLAFVGKTATKEQLARFAEQLRVAA